MRHGRAAFSADFLVYPVLLAVMISLIADEASPGERALALAFVVGGGLLWTLVEYLIHRFVLHGTATHVASLHDQHHAWPRAPMGTPTWLGAAAIAAIVFVSASLGAPFEVTLSLAGGLMAGFLWHGLVHRAIHHGRPQRLARVIAGAARRHDRHHRAGGIGNFGVTTALWDRVFKSELTVETAVRRSEAT
jgi:sterol desaturase/sphingolipid hydroxylase (fatty acid hydroxylase superfamily)